MKHNPKGDASLNFLVVGDWGRRGFFNQSQVAFQMGRIGEKLDIEFVISTGDNFYDDGLQGAGDALFEASFTNIYTAKSLQKKWYSVLGNHDYRGNVEAQLSPILRRLDKRWLCLRSFILNSDHTYDWKGVLPRTVYLNTLLKDLESALKESTASWKIVVGHHAIRSVGHHGDTPELVKFLLPILEANNVDLYMNGHDHCLEHITGLHSPIQFLTSGAGSKAWRGDVKRPNLQNGVQFFYDGQGFMSVQLTQNDVQLVFYNVFGHLLHTWTLSKQLHSDL